MARTTAAVVEGYEDDWQYPNMGLLHVTIEGEKMTGRGRRSGRNRDPIPPAFWVILTVGAAVALAGVILRSVNSWLGYGLIVVAIVGTGIARRRFLQRSDK